MHLILFDIDGTIVDSVKTDDECFIQSFYDLYKIDLSDSDWNNFKNVTDSGLTSEIFQNYFNRQPSENELIDLKKYFYKLIYQRIGEITEIKGTTETLTQLQDHPEISIAFATGGWKETAMLKLSKIRFQSEELILVTANDFTSRTEIALSAIQQSLTKEQREGFDSITYIGDGLWDYKTAEKLKINFIGVDNQQNYKLVDAGATRVIANLADAEQLIRWVIEGD